MKMLFSIRLLLIITLSVVTIGTDKGFAQRAPKNALNKIEGFNVKKQQFKGAYAKYDLVKGPIAYTIYFAEKKNLRAIYVSSKNQLICETFLVIGKDSGYVSTFGFGPSDIQNKEALHFLSEKFVHQLADNVKNDHLLNYSFFTLNNVKSNWVTMKLKTPVLIDNAVRNTNIITGRFKDLFCGLSDYCFDSGCACQANAICKVAQCLDDNDGDWGSCHEQLAELLACAGDGMKTFIKVSLKPIIY